MSSDGKYQYVCSSTNANYSTGVIYYSHDYGKNWIELVQSNGLNWSRVVVSADGNVVSACYLSSTNTYTTIEIAQSSIYYDGNVGINTNPLPQYTLDVSGTMNINASSSTSLALTANGIIQASQFNTTSDYRIKENPISLNDITTTNPLTTKYTIDVLEPYMYKNKLSNQMDLGLIAHEVQQYFPFLVSGNKDDITYQSVNYIGLIPLLIHEIKLLKERSKTNKNKIETYKKK
jgi:hypothetical protein